jgi:CheY-like chemotaxis protein
MHGRIWAQSTIGQGSSFCFEIPLEIDHHADENREKESHSLEDLEVEINALTNTKLLVAEDNKMNQMVLSLILEKTPLEIEFADDGQIAVEKAASNPYDLILIDIQMPNMNGYDATKNIRQNNQNIPIVALSANVMKEDVEKAEEAGMHDYLAKPIEVPELYRVLIKYLK